ncbi:MAG: alpha-glucosidase [Clostridiales bacterium]|nr:alpha-glucosidase [Clostridiales bacterium]
MERKWWQNAIAYQIYPRSFYDSNGDGVGDIRGIIEKLDYLQDLGIDVVWICPVYQSPMDDNGYDISDYYKIDPQFGTNEDMDELIAEAKKRGIKIVMDLVLNHCSDEHPWFKKALADPTCEEADYFFFRKGENGNPPNNWRSMFGGSAWEPVGDGRYYMHIFGKKQPDLNWENPKLRKALYDMINYWLDKGVGGFRIDAIIHIKKDPTLASRAPEADGMCGLVECCRNYPGIGEFLTEMREQTFDRADCMTVAEAPGVPYEQYGDYVGQPGYFSMMFDFTYTEIYAGWASSWKGYKKIGEWTVPEFRDMLFRSQTEIQKVGWGAVYLENHDYPRSLDKYIPDEDHGFASATMLATLYFLLRGTPFIYQGQELGMSNCPWDSVEEFNDISTLNQYQLVQREGCTPEEALKVVGKYSRDNARTPFPWNSGKNAGFTTGKPWLKVNPSYVAINAEDEKKRDDSVYAYYKKLVALRKDPATSGPLGYGTITPCLLDYDDVVAYIRSEDGQNILVVNHFGSGVRKVTLPYDVQQVLLTNYPATNIAGGVLTLQPYQSVVAQIG